jgi:predicted heme/steroid binding protein
MRATSVTFPLRWQLLLVRTSVDRSLSRIWRNVSHQMMDHQGSDSVEEKERMSSHEMGTLLATHLVVIYGMDPSISSI